MKDIKPILSSLGLQESEIAIYLSALEKGPSTVADLAHASGYSRQAVYIAIESLVKRGLMNSTNQQKKSLFAAEHPDRLLAYARRRESEMKDQIEDLARIVPQLELQTGGEKPIVRVYEGEEAVRSIIHEIGTQHFTEMDEFTDLEAMKKVLQPKDTEPIRAAYKKSKAKAKGIYVGEPQTAGLPGSERYFLGKEYAGFKSNIGLYGNSTVLVVFAGKMHSIVIENEYLTKAFKLLFKLAHERAAQLVKKS